MFCPNCGNQINDGAGFCPECGAKMQPAGGNTSPAMNNRQSSAQDGNVPGKGKATASLVLGIITVVFWFTGTFTIVGLILGIIGIAMASMSKKDGFEGGMRTAGFVLSLIGTIGCAIIFAACVACVGALGSLGSLS